MKANSNARCPATTLRMHHILVLSYELEPND